MNERASSIPFGLTSEELLATCGPSWGAMTPEQREAYGPEMEPISLSHGLPAIADLLDLALRFPQSIAMEGLAAVARRWWPDPAVIALAEQLDHEEALEDVVPIIAPAIDDISSKRILRFADEIGYGHATGRKRAALRFCLFLTGELGLSRETALDVLATWDGFNLPPLGVSALGKAYDYAITSRADRAQVSA